MPHLQPTDLPGEEPAPPAWRWWHAWSHLLMAGYGLLLAAYLLWLGRTWGAAIDPAWMRLTAAVVFSSAALIYAVRAARYPALDAQTRRAWAILAVAFACDLLAHGLWWSSAAAPPAPVLAAAFDLAYYPLVLWGLLRMPTARRERAERTTVWLDVGIVTVVAILALWYYVLYPAAAGPAPSSLELALSLAHPVGDSTLLFGLTMTLISRPQPRSRPALVLVSLGLLSLFAADVAVSYLALHAGERRGGWPDAVGALGYFLIANAAQAQCFHIVRRAAPDAYPDLPPRQISALPYLAIAAVYGLLLNTAIHEWREPERGLLIGTAALTFLVAVRQITASRENVRLFREREQLRAAAALAIQQREARFRSLLQNASDGLLVLDRALAIGEVTPPAERLLGYPASELVRRAVVDLVHAEDVRHVQAFLAQTRTATQPVAMACRMRRHDGRWVEVEIVATDLLADPSVGGIVLNIRDLQERRAREAAEAATRAKSIFLAHMSHELRTPLTAMLGFRDLIALQVDHDGYGAIASDLEQIKKSGTHLLALINDVLDLAKIEADRMDLEAEPIAVRPLVDDVLESVAPLVAQNGNRLVVVDDERTGRIAGDAMRLRQVLYNLLSNASKFTRGGVITVQTARVAAEAGEVVQICVSDTGIGMSPEQLRQVFDPYTQADATVTRRYGGTGLGLTLSRHYCRLMGGDLTVTSALGQGTTFVVRLPAQPEAPPPS